MESKLTAVIKNGASRWLCPRVARFAEKGRWADWAAGRLVPLHGERVAVLVPDRRPTVRVWHPRAERRGDFVLPDPVAAVCALFDGERLALASDTGALSVWTPGEKPVVLSHSGHGRGARLLAWGERRIALAAGHRLELWDEATGGAWACAARLDLPHAVQRFIPVGQCSAGAAHGTQVALCDGGHLYAIPPNPPELQLVDAEVQECIPRADGWIEAMGPVLTRVTDQARMADADFDGPHGDALQAGCTPYVARQDAWARHVAAGTYPTHLDGAAVLSPEAVLAVDAGGAAHLWEYRRGARWFVPVLPGCRVATVARLGYNRAALLTLEGDLHVFERGHDPKR